MKEEWKDVAGYEDYFKISNLGNVFSKRTNKILKSCIHRNGYVIMSTMIGGRQGKAICFKVHRLVAEAFLLNPENKLYVNHKDGNKQNNCVDNLEWVTAKENSLHSYETGLSKARRGEDNSAAKLSNKDAEIILKRYVPYCKINGGRALAREFGVSKTIISKIVRKESYLNREEF